MNENCSDCTFCKLPRNPIALVPLQQNFEKFENLLESFDFDQCRAKNFLICFSCNQLLNKYYDFKSDFVGKERELLNYTNAEKTADLCEVLISKGFLDKDPDEKLQICRICYKTSTDDEFTDITYGSKFSTFLTTCVAEFDLFLINKTFICPACRNILLSFYRFLLTWIQVVKSATLEKTASTDPLAMKENSQSEVKSVPKPNAEEIIDLDSPTSTSDELPYKKQKIGDDCELIDIGPTKLEVSSNGEQANESSKYEIIKIVNVEKLLNPSNGSTKNDDVVVVESSSPETAYKKEKDMYRRGRQSKKRISHPNKLIQDAIRKPTKYYYECQICPGQYNSFDEIKKHIESHLTKKFFNCWMCQQILVETDMVESHFKSIHGTGMYKKIEEIDEFFISTEDSRPIVKMFECQICFHHTRNVNDLHKHMTYHIKSEKLNCFNCTFHCNDFQVMQKHLASKHGISTLCRIIHKLEEPRNLTLKNGSTEKETEPVSDKSPISCTSCRREYSTTEEFIIHLCSEPDNNKYCCGHCCNVFHSIIELERHLCEGAFESKKSENSKTDKPLNENQHSKEPKYSNCNLCLVSFKTSQELDNHNCTTKGSKSGNSTNQSLFCDDCSGKFESYDEIIGHICLKPVLVLEHDELKIEDEDFSTTLTSTPTTDTANLASQVIDIDSDSDTEFVEPNFKQADRVVKEIRPVDLQEASQLISQGIQVVTPQNLQYQHLTIPAFVPVMGQEGMVMMNNGCPIMNSEASAHYLNSGGRVYLANGDGENSGAQLIWPQPSNTTQNINTNTPILKKMLNMSPIQALKESVNNIMPIVPSNTPKNGLTNNDYSLVISDDETEYSQLNFSSPMPFANAAQLNQGTKTNNVQRKRKPRRLSPKETNNYICISDDDEIQETEEDCSMIQEQPTEQETNEKIKRPPTSFVIYKEKLKPELEKKFPHLKPKQQMLMAAETWRNLAPNEKWPFMEEARLLKELFKREHPELCNIPRRKPATKKPAVTEMPIMPQISAVFTLQETPIEPIIVLD